MKAINPAKVRRAIEEAGNSWLLDYWGSDADRHLANTARELEEFTQAYEQRFHDVPDPFGLLKTNPFKAMAFFQPDTLASSLPMKMMVYRILLGCEIHRVEFRYQSGQRPLLQISLKTPYEQEEVFEGEDPMDFRVLRHFGATGVSGGLLLQGYYAARPT